jgi:hypothetical protein
MKVFLRFDDIDRHGVGCDCGLCNANGHSYGVAIFPLNRRLAEEADPLIRIYAASEDAAFHNARMFTARHGYRIVDPRERS